MEENNNMFGKITKCSYCGKEMSFFAVIDHEEKCRKIKKICDGYGDCHNKGVIIMTINGKHKSRWCFECFNRYKKEHPEIKFENGGVFTQAPAGVVELPSNAIQKSV